MSAIEEATSEQLDMEKPVQEEEESVPKSISDISAETATQDSGSQNKHDSQAKTTPQSGTEQGPEEGGEGSKPESAKNSSNQSEEQENAPQVNTAGSLPLSSEVADTTQPCKEQDKPGNNSSTAEPLDPAITNSEMGQLQDSASQAEAAVTEPKTSVGDVAETEAETEAPMVQAESAKENDIPHETGSLEQKEESIIPDEVATATKLPTETVEVEGATAAAPSNTSTPTSENKAPIQSVYHIKWLKFRNQNLPIVTQNENGPCPLLAIMNVLLLKGQVKFPPMIEMVTSGQLMDYLGDCIFENAPKNISEDARLNYEQNMHDAMAVFHKLQTGLDVNVRFTGISDFEYTPECIVFDLLAIPLYHGWLVDPESPEMTAAVSNCSYNQLVEKIISNKNSNKEELMTEALLAEEFLERTAAQLTYHGLSELSSQTKESELCVFFRNNHFSTVYKHKTELFLLVTDQGFLTESGVVWETLSNVEGDGHFVDADFRTYTKPEPSTATIPAPVVPPGSDQQIDTDYLVALSLQQEGQETQTQDASWQSSQGSEGDVPAGTNVPPGPQPLSDHELAMHLQEEENQRAAAMQQRQQQRQVQRQTSRERKKSDNCVII